MSNAIMTLIELQALKIEAQTEIAKVIEEFELKSGLSIEHIELATEATCYRPDDGRERKIRTVCLEVRL